MIGLGVLGAAAIARKNVRAIGLTKNGIGALPCAEGFARYFFQRCGFSCFGAAEVVAVGSRTLSKAEAFIKETKLEGKAKAFGRCARYPQQLISSAFSD